MARKNVTPLVLEHPYLPVRLSEDGDVFVAGAWLEKPKTIFLHGEVFDVRKLYKEAFG